MSNVHGGRLVAQALKRHGVTAVFTVCGTHTEAMCRGCLEENIQVVDVHQEQTAGYAADALARLSGVPGVAIVSAGPGTSNCITALANARAAGVPMVVITATTPLALTNRGAAGEIDEVNLVATVTKWATRVTDVRRIGELLDHAFRVALGGNPGPTLVAIPSDVLSAVAPSGSTQRIAQAIHRPAVSEECLKQVERRLAASQRPVFIVGSELRWSTLRPSLAQCAERLGAPFFLNGLARGSLPHDHPSLLSLCRRRAMQQADLIVLIGTPIDFRLDFGEGDCWNRSVRLIHASLDSERLGQNRSADVTVCADAGLFLEQISTQFSGEKPTAWLQSLRQLESSLSLTRARNTEQRSIQTLCDRLSQRLGAEDILIGDGGDFVARVARTLKLSASQTWLDSGPFGTLGVGPGFALAAAIHQPKAQIVLLTGDSTFALGGCDWEPLVRHRAAVTCIVGANGERERLTRIEQGIATSPEPAPANLLGEARLEEVVVALGGQGVRVQRDEQLDEALKKALESRSVFCLTLTT